jgi:LPXTG-motif cell wall-anchored protein
MPPWRRNVRSTSATDSPGSVLPQTDSSSKPLVELGLFLAALGSVGYLAGHRRTKVENVDLATRVGTVLLGKCDIDGDRTSTIE